MRMANCVIARRVGFGKCIILCKELKTVCQYAYMTKYIYIRQMGQGKFLFRKGKKEIFHSIFISVCRYIVYRSKTILNLSHHTNIIKTLPMMFCKDTINVMRLSLTFNSFHLERHKWRIASNPQTLQSKWRFTSNPRTRQMTDWLNI